MLKKFFKINKVKYTDFLLNLFCLESIPEMYKKIGPHGCFQIRRQIESKKKIITKNHISYLNKPI